MYVRNFGSFITINTILNSIPILNPNVFKEAAASDDRRASGQAGRLEGIPFTVKDSFKVKGMTVSCGSPAFKNLISSEDAFTVSSIRAAGGVLIGKTNMPSMAYGGMQRGIYGRAESPSRVPGGCLYFRLVERGKARKRLESLGAEILLVPDCPAVTAYENPELLQGVTGLPEKRQWTEKGPLIAHGWDLFLRSNGDLNTPNLASVDESNIYTDSLRTPAELENQPTQNVIHWGKLVGYVREGTGSMFDIKNLDAASIALDLMRKQLSDDYLERYRCDCFVFPAAGDVGSADADVDLAHAAHAWANGVFCSTGNRALRHPGNPIVTVPTGMIPGKDMSIGLTFTGRGFDDEHLLKWANAFEAQTKLRSPTPHTPALPSDLIQLSSKSLSSKTRPHLLVTKCTSKRSTETAVLRVEFEGTVDVDSTGSKRPPAIQVAVDGQDVPDEQITIDRVANESGEGHSLYVFRGWEYTPGPPERREKDAAREQVCGDQIMVVFLTRSSPSGLPAGFLSLM
ncbi:unnamed protein product, partial [Clonostachys rhizophaga]